MWRRLANLLPGPTLPRNWDDVQPTGGREAREQAERQLEEVRSRAPYYRELGRTVKRIRVENHIGPDIAVAITPRGGAR